MNLTKRKLWTPQEGLGAEDLDYADYKFFNPTMADLERLLFTTSAVMLDGSSTTSTLPKRVKLSDSAMGLVVQSNASVVMDHVAWLVQNGIASTHHIGISTPYAGEANLYIEITRTSQVSERILSSKWIAGIQTLIRMWYGALSRAFTQFFILFLGLRR